MRTIHFKNGKTKKISQEIANIIRNSIIKGCSDFQCFSNDEDDVHLIIKLGEVVYID